MSKLSTLLALIILLSFSSCDVLKQLAQQQQQGKGQGNQGGGQVTNQGPVDCTTAKRYINPVFSAGNVNLVSDITYATATKQEQWNNGNTSSDCYGVRTYKTPTSNGNDDLKLDVYMPKGELDNCPSRALILFVHQGGFSQRETPNKTMGSIAGRAKYLAQMGYVVAVMDYRKGYDFGKNTYEAGSLAALLIPGMNLDCMVNSTPDPKTFQVAMFRFVQDIRAAHRFLHKNSDRIGFDTDKVFYLGLSTGAIGIAHAAYAADESQHWSKFGLGSVESFGNFPELESEIKIAGVLAEQPALHKTEWLEASDNVPMYMMQGTADKDVPFGAGHLAGLTSYNGGQAGVPYFELFGSKSLYNQFKTIGGGSKTIGHLSAFEDITHHLQPMTSGGCPQLKNGLKGIWQESYAFAKEIIEAVDEGRSANITTGYCLYKNPKNGNCYTKCE